MDQTLATTGQVIEPIIREYVASKLKINFKVYDPPKVN